MLSREPSRAQSGGRRRLARVVSRIRRLGRRASRPSETPVTPALAATRCAALLRGGVQPKRAIAMLARDSPSPETQVLADEVGRGATIGEACASLPGPGWRVLGAAWMLAEVSGAPFAPVLDRIASALRDVEAVARRREVLLTTPRATVSLVSVLPAVAIAAGFFLGFDPLPVFLTPFGLVLLGSGCCLHLVGLRWIRRLTQRVVSADRVAGLECEMLWVALAGGGAPRGARLQLVDAVSASHAEWVTFESLRAGRALDVALQAAVEAGVPASGMLLEVAAESRAQTQSELEREAERLGVRILLPLASCVLPAFVLLGVVPVVVSLISGTGVF